MHHTVHPQSAQPVDPPFALTISHEQGLIAILGPDPLVTITELLGGTAPSTVDTELGILEFWVGAVADSQAPINGPAMILIEELIEAALTGDLAVSDAAQSRIKTLRAHGWAPQIRGHCVVTGPLGDDGVPAPLPERFFRWLEARVHAAQNAHIERVLAELTEAGLHVHLITITENN
ncbi:hypothetical protein [Alloactinosynnema sp. L-07]|uniref:hypothetical protein n=1 Tax=Alloactinosynnema sp. L-07 TaxID=1653480 RepID=UPI00065F0861|nr:hypothetical protein [Alloactinosynnema sp. L-07]CRK59202.1 hypothetical protein [Alloactinosynnema sp. L-07]